MRIQRYCLQRDLRVGSFLAHTHAYIHNRTYNCHNTHTKTKWLHKSAYWQINLKTHTYQHTKIDALAQLTMQMKFVFYFYFQLFRRNEIIQISSDEHSKWQQQQFALEFTNVGKRASKLIVAYFAYKHCGSSNFFFFVTTFLIYLFCFFLF